MFKYLVIHYFDGFRLMYACLLHFQIFSNLSLHTVIHFQIFKSPNFQTSVHFENVIILKFKKWMYQLPNDLNRSYACRANLKIESLKSSFPIFKSSYFQIIQAP